MLEILLFAALAVFVIFKLYNTLGKHDEEDKNIKSPFAQKWTQKPVRESKAQPHKEADITIYSGFEASLPQYIRDVFDNIRLHDKSFDSSTFFQNAKEAFKIITKAIDHGKKDFLAGLVDKDMYNIIATEIEQLQKEGRIFEHQIIEFLPGTAIENASLKENNALIAVRFVSKQKEIEKDLKGKVLKETMEPIVKNEVWVFRKPLSSKESVWVLVSR